MAAPDDLKPQEPGTAPTADPGPNMGAPDDDMQHLAEGTVAVIVETLSALTDDELESLAVYEQRGKARKGVLEAIEAEMDARITAPDPQPAVAPSDDTPATFSRPYLTAAGWVVPEPHQKPEA